MCYYSTSILLGEIRVYKLKIAVLVALLLALLACILTSLYALISGVWPTAKLLYTAGALAALTGILQLTVSGLWEKTIAFYEDREAEFPYGPPSNVMREIVWHPDKPIRSTIRSYIIFNTSTALWLAALSAFLGGVAAWL